MPLTKFCGYENSAFQAKNTFAVEAFNSPASLCLKGNNLHNRRYATCGRRRPYHCCLKGRTTAVTQTNTCAGKNKPTGLKFVIGNLKFPFPTSFFLHFLFLIIYPKVLRHLFNAKTLETSEKEKRLS